MRSFIAILFTVVLVIQVTVMAQDKKLQQDESSRKQNIEKCSAGIFSTIKKGSAFSEQLDIFNVTDGSGAAGLDTAAKEVEESLYKTTYDCCSIAQEDTKKKAYEILAEKDSKNRLEKFQNSIQTFMTCMESFSLDDLNNLGGLGNFVNPLYELLMSINGQLVKLSYQYVTSQLGIA